MASAWFGSYNELGAPTSRTVDIPSSRRLYANFIIFSVCFSITHATVDAVLAYATAELGTKYGSYSGFLLYIICTMSALCISKSSLRLIGPKKTVLYGMRCLLFYVASFLLVVILKCHEWIFLVGASIGGLGAGILWTGQASYYASNSQKYVESCDGSVSEYELSSKFAGIFACIYLSFEAIFKAISTGLSVIKVQSWLPIVFGFYTVCAFLSTEIFGCFVVHLYDDRVDDAPADESSAVAPDNVTGKMRDIRRDIYSTLYFISSNKQILFLIPYQISFGLYASFINYYVNSNVVANHVGIGYIGVLSAVATITAAVVAMPCSYAANRFKKCNVIILGALSFAAASTMMLTLSNKAMAFWPLIVFYYVLYGLGRSIWENTNKSVITDYFQNPLERDMAYATVYFFSGISAAFGFLFYQFANRTTLVLINFIIPIFSCVSFLFGDSIVEANKTDSLRVHKFDAVLGECFDIHDEIDINPIHFPTLDESC